MKLLSCCFLLFILSCQSLPEDISPELNQTTTASFAGEVTILATTGELSGPRSNPTAPTLSIPRASVILGRKQVPILCYHQVRDWKPTDSKMSKDYIMPPSSLREQLQMLADSGYHTILPDQLYAYLTTGAALPSRPIMLTFDDTDEDQFTEAFPDLKKHGFKAVFFIMTVSLGRLPHY